MAYFEYRDSPFPIRNDLVRAHRHAWSVIARPGTWWTGTARVAIAEEVRLALACELCATRKGALSPYAIEGTHATTGVLPRVAVEAVHRITTDPARLKKSWYEALLDATFTDAHYVELIGILVTVLCIDALHRALGLPLEPLPAPEPGAPTRVRPPTALTTDQAWVPMISPQSVKGTPEQDLYPSGRVGNVISAMSLVPDAVRLLSSQHTAHYVDVFALGFPGEAERALTRPQIELIAARVSALNDCFY